MKIENAEVLKENIERLKLLLHDGKYQVYSILRHVSQSGMQRVISFYTIVDNEPICLDNYIDMMLDYKRAKNQGLIVRGCGMDMGFHVVYSLSVALYCPDKYNHDKAYILKNRWL